MSVDEVLYACKESEKELVSINSNGQEDLDLIQRHDRLPPASGMAARTPAPDTYCDIGARRARPHLLTIRSHLRKLASEYKKT